MTLKLEIQATETANAQITLHLKSIASLREVAVKYPGFGKTILKTLASLLIGAGLTKKTVEQLYDFRGREVAITVGIHSSPRNRYGAAVKNEPD